MEGIDRRESERISKENTFQFAKLQNGNIGQLNSEGSMIDYSVAGLRFATNEPLEKNTALLIQLNLDDLDNDEVDWKTLWETGDAESLKIIGSVMWCMASKLESNIFEVGMRFTQKAAEQ
jgi:hypothetical protein